VPLACADSGARTLVIGLGSGVTLAAALAAGAGPTEVVELEPRVVEASRFFHRRDEHPIDDARVRLVVGDARTHLAHGGGRYDVIVSEPSNPWMAGVNNLFTVDFYRRARARLDQDGVFCQWIQLYELSPRTLGSLLGSFFEVFPSGHAFTACRSSDLLLVAMPAARRIALERLQSTAARRVFARAGMSSPEALAGHYVAPFSTLRALADGAPLNRDDLPIVEHWAPQDLVTIGRTAKRVHPLESAGMVYAQSPPPGPLFSAWSAESWFEWRARVLVEEDQLEVAAATARAAADAGQDALARRLVEEIGAGARRRQALAEAERGRSLLASGRDTEGLEVLQNAARLDPTNAQIWLWIADRRRLARDFTGAEAGLARARACGDSTILADAALISGLLEIDRSAPLAAAEHFRAVQRLSPDRLDGYLFEAAARAASGDTAGARATLHRGLERLPGETDLHTLLLSLSAIP
jgi:hypothetical protein